MRSLRQFVVMLDFGSMHRIFSAIYALGVRVVVVRMARRPAVHAIHILL
ncbi:hypothetical protein HQ535_10255 [bacterium]|nr:hypothetical protein [bacterium]